MANALLTFIKTLFAIPDGFWPTMASGSAANPLSLNWHLEIALI
jgi:hypothetical protein